MELTEAFGSDFDADYPDQHVVGDAAASRPATVTARASTASRQRSNGATAVTPARVTAGDNGRTPVTGDGGRRAESKRSNTESGAGHGRRSDAGAGGDWGEP